MSKIDDNAVRMSVVVPVYNKSEYLDECIASLLRQTAANGSFEALFIDDGSTDDSLQICKAAEQKHDFIRVISQENQGVSGARNTGIRNARGDYILFLDADDAISASTIQKLIAAFDSFGDATDVISYPIVYCDAITGKERRHAREKWLTEQMVYHLEDVPLCAQSTMNVCVRNRGDSAVFFNGDLRMGEDQLFVTQNLADKATIGCCPEAEYRYTRDGSTASSRMNKPLYAYGDMMMLFRQLQSLAIKNVLLRRYAQHLILYNVDWRLRSNSLFPSHLKGEEREMAEEELGEILRWIPQTVYAENSYLSPYHKAFLMKRYLHADGDVRVVHTTRRTLVVFEDETIWRAGIPQITVERCTYFGGILRMRARLACPSFRFEEKPELKIRFSNKTKEVELGVSSHCYSSAYFPITKAWSFTCELDLSNVTEKTPIDFVVSVGGQRVPALSVAIDARIHNARIIDDQYCFSHLSLKVKKGSLVAYPRKAETPKKLFLKADLKNPDESRLRRSVASFVRKNKDKRYWMYVDLPTSPVEGNAMQMLLHDMRMNDGVERRYVSQYKNLIEQRHPELAGLIIELDSPMHKMLSLRAEMVIHSYLERFTHMAFSVEEFDTVADYAIRQTRVYVQHGILHADMPWYLSYDRQMFDKEIISTTMENDVLQQRYCTPDDALICTGAPRLDRLTYSFEPKQNRILFAPSWRESLVSGPSYKRIYNDDLFMNSVFYKGITDFINLVSASGILEEHGYTLELKLHPNFKKYEHLFQFKSDAIRSAPDNVNENEYSVFITDFSSYVYDFVYTGADVIYYVPDIVEFRAGLNQYFNLVVPFEDAFGQYCETADQAFTALKNCLDPLWPERAQYQKKRENFFLYTDGEACERAYRYLKDEADRHICN